MRTDPLKDMRDNPYRVPIENGKLCGAIPLDEGIIEEAKYYGKINLTQCELALSELKVAYKAFESMITRLPPYRAAMARQLIDLDDLFGHDLDEFRSTIQAERDFHCRHSNQWSHEGYLSCSVAEKMGLLMQWMIDTVTGTHASDSHMPGDIPQDEFIGGEKIMPYVVDSINPPAFIKAMHTCATTPLRTETDDDRLSSTLFHLYLTTRRIGWTLRDMAQEYAYHSGINTEKFVAWQHQIETLATAFNEAHQRYQECSDQKNSEENSISPSTNY